MIINVVSLNLSFGNCETRRIHLTTKNNSRKYAPNILFDMYLLRVLYICKKCVIYVWKYLNCHVINCIMFQNILLLRSLSGILTTQLDSNEIFVYGYVCTYIRFNIYTCI